MDIIFTAIATAVIVAILWVYFSIKGKMDDNAKAKVEDSFRAQLPPSYKEIYRNENFVIFEDKTANTCMAVVFDTKAATSETLANTTASEVMYLTYNGRMGSPVCYIFDDVNKCMIEVVGIPGQVNVTKVKYADIKSVSVRVDDEFVYSSTDGSTIAAAHQRLLEKADEEPESSSEEEEKNGINEVTLVVETEGKKVTFDTVESYPARKYDELREEIDCTLKIAENLKKKC